MLPNPAIPPLQGATQLPMSQGSPFAVLPEKQTEKEEIRQLMVKLGGWFLCLRPLEVSY